MQGVRDYSKFIKRGYSRPTHLVALDVRNGRISKEEGDRLVREFEGRRPPSLDLFLDFIGLTEQEFLEIAMTHQVSPYMHDPSRTQPGNALQDTERWSKEGPMDRADAEVQIIRWKSRQR
jgi:hypothetical protein